MPKVVDAQSPTPAGCKITGIRLYPGGTPNCTPLEVTLTRPGVYQGVVYGTEPFLVVPASDGRFEMTLPPSSALGPYKVQTGATVWNMVVPDTPNADFSDIAQL